MNIVTYFSHAASTMSESRGARTRSQSVVWRTCASELGLLSKGGNEQQIRHILRSYWLYSKGHFRELKSFEITIRIYWRSGISKFVTFKSYTLLFPFYIYNKKIYFLKLNGYRIYCNNLWVSLKKPFYCREGKTTKSTQIRGKAENGYWATRKFDLIEFWHPRRRVVHIFTRCK